MPLYVDYIIKDRIKNQKISENVQRKISKLYNDNLFIDYIWVPNNIENISAQFHKYQSDKVDFITMTDKWERLGAKIYQRRSIKECLFNDKVIKKIYDLSPNEAILIKTKSGYFIVQQFAHLKEKEEVCDNNKGKILQQLKIAQAIDAGDTLLDPNVLQNSIYINKNSLKSINFFIEPLIDKKQGNNIIAEFAGKKISEQELKELISHLPLIRQALFKSNSTKIDATIALLTKNDEYNLQNNRNVLLILLKQKLMVQYLIETKIQKETGLKDTILFLQQWINKLSMNNPKQPVYEILLTDAYLRGIEQKDFIQNKLNDFNVNINSTDKNNLRASEYYNYLNNKMNKLKINFILLERMEISKTKVIDENKIIASKGNWTLTVRHLNKILNNLTPESRVNIVLENNVMGLIEYLAKNEGKFAEVNRMKIDHKILDNIDIAGNSFDFVNSSYAKEEAIIGKLGNYTITVNELRKKVYSMSKEHQEKFLNLESREVAFKELLIEGFWLSIEDRSEIEKNIFFQKDFEKSKNWILSEALYKNDIYIEPFNLPNEQYDYLIRSAFKRQNQKKLEDFLIQSAKETKIEVSMRLLRQLGIDINKSKYQTLLTNFN